MPDFLVYFYSLCPSTKTLGTTPGTSHCLVVCVRDLLYEVLREFP